MFWKKPDADKYSSKLTVAAGINREQAARLLMRLEILVEAPLHLRINNNTSTLLSLTRPRDGSPVRFSVNCMFLGASEEIVEALGQYVTRATPRCQTVLRDYMDNYTASAAGQMEEAITALTRNRPLQLRARGRHYDLHRLADEVNREYFDGSATINISWSRGALEPRNGKNRRHIIFGSYDKRHSLVKIHPALDSAEVPEFFVKFVIFHEMLHHVVDVRPQPGGRRCVHTTEFRDRERRHPDFRRAMEWERLFMQGKHKQV